MPVQLLLGPEGSGKTQSLLGDLSAAIPRGKGILIVPTEAMARELRRHLLLSDGPYSHTSRSKKNRSAALMGDVVIPWNRFIEKIADARCPVLSNTQAVLLLHRLLERHPLRYFRMKRRSLGLARQFAETILALKRNGIDSKRLAGLLATRGSLKENDLLTLFARYEEELGSRHLLDEGDLPSLALDRICEGCAPLLAGKDLILFDAFHAFRPGQMAAIGALKKALPRADIRIAFPQAERDTIGAAFLEEGGARLVKLADAVVSLKRGRRPKPEINVCTARSPIQEARAHARMIAEACEERISPEEIALVFRSGAPFLQLFCEEAAASGLLSPDAIPAGPMQAAPLHELFSPAVVEAWPEEALPASYASCCEEFLRGRRSIAAWSEELSDGGAERTAVSESLGAVAALEELLREIAAAAALTEVGPISRDAFVELATSELSARGGSPPARGNIPCRLVPFEAGLSLPVRRLFLPQMAEGTIPRFQGERLFFSEADRLAADPDPVLDWIFPAGEEALAAEALLFDGLLAKGIERILITYPQIDEGASEAAPSSFLDDLPEAIPFPLFPAGAPIADPGREKRRDRMIAIERAREVQDDSHPEHRGLITSTAARALVRERFTREALSPTRLERYAECPFVFFAEKVLGLSPLEEESPEMAPKDRGTILHALLERLYRDHLDLFRKAIIDPAAEKKISAVMGELLDAVLAEHASLVGHAAAALAPLSREAIRTMAWQVVALELAEARGLPAPLLPATCEWAFGTSTENALAIPVEGDRPALIGGRIDRIDTDERRRRFLIVDYKTGAKVEAVKNDILSGRHLQLPLYAEAVHRLLFPDALPLGGLLLAVQQGEKRHGFVRREFNGTHYDVGRAHSAMDDGAWEKAIAAALSAAALFAGQIRAGQFYPKPPEGCPRHCDYDETCRYIGRGAH